MSVTEKEVLKPKCSIPFTAGKAGWLCLWRVAQSTIKVIFLVCILVSYPQIAKASFRASQNEFV